MTKINLNPLRNILANGIQGVINQNGNLYFALIEELDSQAIVKNLQIGEVCQGSLLLKLDKYIEPSSLFKANRKGILKRCDYVLITKYKTENILLFIEMKSSMPNNNELILQFNGGQSVVAYCEAIMKYFSKNNDYFNNFEKRFVLFYDSQFSIAKTVTVPNKTTNIAKNITPKTVLKYDYKPKVLLNELLI